MLAQRAERDASVGPATESVAVRQGGLEVGARLERIPGFQLRHREVVQDRRRVWRGPRGTLERAQRLGIFTATVVHPAEGIELDRVSRGGERRGEIARPI